MPIEHITQTDPYYPEQLKKYLKTEAPEIISARGNIDLLIKSRPMPARRSLGDLLLQQMSRRDYFENPRPSPAIQKIGGIDHRRFSFPGREGMSSCLAARRTADYNLSRTEY